ncbi:hypothetical protein [Gordonia amarae]|uniref:hypothetical protein n=1 Tax=Gordonia amarae TaxID=36821 RepID=UPI001AFBE539|nr:hypothetical protein [Gordonia amarae]QHN16559.1 hypothetical protein GII35_05785 [Gordonia amarae]
MNETAQRILTAEQTINRMQADQLRWAETSPEAAAALHAARTRAVLKVAAQLGAGVGLLHDLRIVMSDAWSVKVEHGRTLVVAVDEWDKENCCVNGYDPECDILSITGLLEELWPDVIAETDAWARRHASTQE